MITATWNEASKEDLYLDTTGNWVIKIRHDARVRTVKKELEGLLLLAESQGLTDLRTNHLMRRYDEALFDQCERLGIVAGFRSKDAGNGRVTLTLVGWGGGVDSSGESVASWMLNF